MVAKPKVGSERDQMSEHLEQVAFFRMVELMKGRHPELCWLHAIPNGGARTASVGAKMKAEGVKRGVWDVFLPYPKGNWHGLYIEMKYGKNGLTQEQKEFGAFVDGQGY